MYHRLHKIHEAHFTFSLYIYILIYTHVSPSGHNKSNCFVFRFWCSLSRSFPFFFFFLMAASVDPLVVGRVIGDVVDMFVPTVNMSAYFGPKHVTNGCDIKPSMAVNPPKVTLSGHSDELYSLVCACLCGRL
jgi:hypothetical protein